MEQALANAAWALAKQGYDDRRVVVSFLQQAWDKLLEVDSAHVAGTMWALANLHLEDPRFIHQLLHHIRPRLWACTPQALANTAVAVARSKHHDSTFVQLLLLHCRSKLSLFSPGLLCSLAWALAVLNHSDAGFVDSLVQQLLRDPSKLERQQLCVLLWSLSILEHDTTAASPPLVAAACRELLQPCSPGSTERPATAEQLRLVHQFVATLESEGAVGADLWAQPQYQQLRALCQAAWVEDVRQASPTHMHQELLVAARQVPGCSNAQALQLTDDGLLRVDLALRLPSGVNVAIDLDAAQHFMTNAPDIPDGAVIWRRRMLLSRGYQVVSVPVPEWEQLRDSQRRQEYLQQRLRSAGLLAQPLPA